MTDSMGPGKVVRHMQNPSYTYDEYLICTGLGPSISSVICKNPSYCGPSYPSSPVYHKTWICYVNFLLIHLYLDAPVIRRFVILALNIQYWPRLCLEVPHLKYLQDKICIPGEFNKLLNGKINEKMSLIIKLWLLWPWMAFNITTEYLTLGWLHEMERLSYNKHFDTKQCPYCLMLTTFMT